MANQKCPYFLMTKHYVFGNYWMLTKIIWTKISPHNKTVIRP